jgi:hypothetical protein
MTYKMPTIGAGLAAGLLVAVSIATAQDNDRATANPVPQMSEHHRAMMDGQANRMVEHCSRMMKKAPASPDTPTVPQGNPKG